MLVLLNNFRIGLLGASVALIATAPNAPDAQPLPLKIFSPLEILDLEPGRDNRMTVEVTIDKQGPYNFLIDTGAQSTVLSTEVADSLGFHDRGIATLVGVTSRRKIETTQIRNLGLGSRNFNLELVALVPHQNLGGADGILGLDSLQNQRVLLDFAKCTIAVADAETLGGNRGYDIVVRARRKLGQLIITNARLDGVRVTVIIDTGAQSSIGNLALHERLRGRDQGEAEMIDINGVKMTGDTRLTHSVKIGRASINNVAIVFTASPTFEVLGLSDEPTLLLGMKELELFRRVAIDFSEHKVLFDLPDERAPFWMGWIADE
jgi:predicted aspartyl protease